ncbi:hypothetical protein ACFFX0_33100 [Citricoccus parietis]|uniref:Uncharacterized protein n=1 Tax=Citricoccus parietis TaxID=592307 RepID=A0ABV5G9X5_9MICC
MSGSAAKSECCATPAPTDGWDTCSRIAAPAPASTTASRARSSVRVGAVIAGPRARLDLSSTRGRRAGRPAAGPAS